MAEHVILFTGPMGAGKTTAIRAISEIDMVTTEAPNTDRAAFDKDTTTVALDYGEILVSDEEKVRLYGIPGQRRFEFMWRILAERAMGMVLLVNQSAPDPIADLREYLGEFTALLERGAVVVGVTRSREPGPPMPAYSEALWADHPGVLIPVLEVDPRDPADVRVALMSLIASIEAKAAYGKVAVR